jgi:hypothetical protein
MLSDDERAALCSERATTSGKEGRRIHLRRTLRNVVAAASVYALDASEPSARQVLRHFLEAADGLYSAIPAQVKP